IGLLFAQAHLDLALPDYLSNIVDTGIQQGGVEYAAPVAIRETEMERLFIFMSSENRSSVLKDYTLINESSTDFESNKEFYPILENESIYLLNDVKRKELTILNDLLVEPLVIIFSLKQILANPNENYTAMFLLVGINLTAISSETELFGNISALPQMLLDGISGAITEQFDILGETMLMQIAIMTVRLEYDVIGLDVDKIQSNYILRAGGLMLLMTILSVICTVIVGYLASRTAAGMARDIRFGVFKKIEHFSNAEFDQFSTASLITRSTNDVTQIQTVVFMIVRLVFYAPILGVGGIIHAMNKNKDMTWLIGIAVLVLIVLIGVIILIAVPKFNRMQTLTDRINLVARENLTGMLVIRAFNKEKYEQKRFDKVNKDLTSVTLFITRVMVIMMPFMMLIMNGLMLGIIWVGSHKVDEFAMQVGDMLAFMQYSMQIVFAFLMLTMMFIVLPRSVVSARRINEVLQTKPIIVDPENPKVFSDSFKGTIEFRNVSFKYPGAKKGALQGISFTAQPGQTTAIIGATGSGKSTILNLIMRFYDVTKGSVRVDGLDIRQVTQHDLRAKVGYVPQKTILFSGTIESNLRFANEDADEEALRSAIEIAQATEFVSSKPDGLESAIAQGGANVSGGQKQRLAIARALMNKPPIYIFDDSVSALDFKTDAALRKALKEKTGDSTVIMVTQRVSTIKNAEQILVIDEGQIVGKGTHDELMTTCDIYKEIAYKEIAVSQLELEELS
ncbi:MAG: ABC transporter ATP-binding protein, partial [Candidatus Heimdallarchaeota archaeon]